MHKESICQRMNMQNNFRVKVCVGVVWQNGKQCQEKLWKFTMVKIYTSGT